MQFNVLICDLIRANPLPTYAQKPRTETEEKAGSSERAKAAIRRFQSCAAKVSVKPRAAVGNGTAPRAAHIKNKTDRQAYNGCCPCGDRDHAVCLCLYIDETMRGDFAGGIGDCARPSPSSRARRPQVRLPRAGGGSRWAATVSDPEEFLSNSPKRSRQGM
jgi:hypothetical protein